MERTRQTKILSIIALVIAITGMTLGFAAFSSTLSISSSASVNPNSSDFKIKIYGYPETTVDNIFNIAAYTSENVGYGFDNNTGNLLDTVASINNANLTITGINTKMTQPTDDHIFSFKITNEGQYNAYFDLAQLTDATPILCNADPETTEELVNAACDSIIQAIIVYDEETMNVFLKYANGEISDEEYEEYMINYDSNQMGIIKLEKNKSLALLLNITYSGDNRADGPFSVTFEDIKLEFTTAPPNQ